MRNLTLILCVIALVGSAASGVMFYLVGNTKQRLQQRLTAAEANGAALASDLADTQTQVAQLTERARSLDSALATTKRELTESQLQHEKLQAALDLVETDRATAVRNAELAQAQLNSAHLELAAARDRLANSVPPEQAIRYRQTIADLEGRIEQLDQRARERTAIAVTQTSAPELIAGRGLYAQVMTVGPQNAFVVVNFGQKHGALVNQRMEIKRGPNHLAFVEISDSRENYSVAQVLPDSLSGTLRKGDAATLIQ